MSHAAVKSFDRRGVSFKNARTVQFSVTMFDSNYGSIVLSALVFAVMTTGRTTDGFLTWSSITQTSRQATRLLQTP